MDGYAAFDEEALSTARTSVTIGFLNGEDGIHCQSEPWALMKFLEQSRGIPGGVLL